MPLSRSASSRGGDAFQRRHQVILGLADMRDLELAAAVLGRKRPVLFHRKRVFGERPQLDLAAHAVRSADPGEHKSVRPPPRAATAYALAASAWALRSLRGTAFSGLLRTVALHDAGGIEKTGDAVGWLRALGKPSLDLVHVELEPCFVVLRQQRIEMAETFDEAAVTGKARVGDDDVINRALLGAGTGKAEKRLTFSSPSNPGLLFVVSRHSGMRAQHADPESRRSFPSRFRVRRSASPRNDEILISSSPVPESRRGPAGSACRSGR